MCQAISRRKAGRLHNVHNIFTQPNHAEELLAANPPRGLLLRLAAGVTPH